MTRTKSEEVRELLAVGKTPYEVERTLGVSRQLVSLARKRGGKRGRPRKHFSEDEVAEACAQHVEALLGAQGAELAQGLRSGEWRERLAHR